jgi:hypothetical protein
MEAVEMLDQTRAIPDGRVNLRFKPFIFNVGMPLGPSTLGMVMPMVLISMVYKGF